MSYRIYWRPRHTGEIHKSPVLTKLEFDPETGAATKVLKTRDDCDRLVESLTKLTKGGLHWIKGE